MNKFYVFALCLFTLFFSSCQFSEDIYINDDGSGKISFSFDGTQLMQMAGDEFAEDGEEAIDSTFSFKEIFDEKRDSISKLSEEEQAKLKSLEDYKMHMLMNPETKEMKFELFTEFDKATDMKDMFKAMNNFSNMNGKGPAKANDPNNPFSALGEDGNTKLDYTFDGTTFTRKVTVLDKEIQKQLGDSLQEMAAMFGTSTYKLNYHFPKPIKSVSNNEAMFSADRKTVTLEFPFMTYALDPEALNLEIVLED